jgi:uncharacterized glyoxalase superfamily protein PhnB
MSRIGPVAAVLCCKEPQAAIDCLVDKLGFTLGGSVGEGPAWASLTLGGLEIMVLGGDYPAPAQDWAAYIYVENGVDALYADAVQRGADIKGPPIDKPYNNREFEARLPDGRIIVFGGS